MDMADTMRRRGEPGDREIARCAVGRGAIQTDIDSGPFWEKAGTRPASCSILVGGAGFEPATLAV